MVTIMVVVAYLTNGTPLPNFFIIREDEVCNNELAMSYARRFIVPSLPEGYSIQGDDKTIFLCADVPPGTPGPAMKPVLFPGQTEAAQLR